jgi:uncharacterized protein YegL
LKDSTYISVLLDRSGSMGSVKDETISGFNHFLNEQKKAGDNASLSLVQFDTQGIDTVHENVPIKDIPELNGDTYQPRGGTPLLDALGGAIESTGKVLSAIPEEKRHDKVVFVVITDGQENSSRKFTKAKIREMIEHQTNTYQWNFVYLGANQDAFDEAAQIGIGPQTVSNYATVNTRTAFAATSSNLAAMRRTGVRGSLNYSAPQRTSMGPNPPKR